jgi:HAMP domain-containing protein
MFPMKLIWKFNLVLLVIFAIGFAGAGYVSHVVLQANAREEVVQSARVIMEGALASRNYTNTQVKPLLEAQLKDTFLRQSVPAYAATEQFNDVRKKFPEFSYKEATLNPTNPRDRATDWEADVVNEFRNYPSHTEVIGERETPTGRSLYLARPIRITSAACLVCHSTVDVAPKTMVDVYGGNNGFGWAMNEVIGAQVVSVPMSVPIERAAATLKTFMLALAGVFVLTFVALNVMLHTIVIRRVTLLAKLADDVSLGRFDAGEFHTRSRDEIGILTQALGRMKTSLVKAMKMLEE